MILFLGWIYSQEAAPSAFKYERLSMDNAAVILVNHQTGIALGVKDKNENDIKAALLALVKLAKLYQLPTIITPSRPDRQNGPIIPEILNILDNAIVINRMGEINAIDNKEVLDAVKATGRTKFIVSGHGGIVHLVAFSLRQEGYDVYVALDSSGTFNENEDRITRERMVHGGIQPMTWFAIACELQRDWRNSTAEGFTQIIKEHLPWYGYLIDSWDYTVKNGEGLPSEGQGTQINTENQSVPEVSQSEGGNTELGSNTGMPATTV